MKVAVFIILLTIIFPVLAGYPDEYIKVVVHVPPGGGTDNMARLVLLHVGKRLGVSFVVENYKGAGGQVGYTTLAQAKANGYTIGTITTTSIITHELVRKNVAYRLQKSFIPIARVAMDPAGLFVRSDSPFQTFEDLLKYAQTRPGMLSCGGTSLWGTHHVHTVLLEKVCGIKLNYIPFDGGAEVRNYLLGGHIDVAAGGTSEFTSLVRAGKVRQLAIAGEQRMSGIPDTPTYRELGYDLLLGSSRGFAAPAGMPPEYVVLLSKTIEEVMSDPEFLKKAEKISLAPILAYLDAEDFRNTLYRLSKTIGELVGDWELGD